MNDKWDKDYTVLHMPEGVHDVVLSKLPPEKKNRLWKAIKERDPAKAAVMLEGLAFARQLDPAAELTLSNVEIEQYLA